MDLLASLALVAATLLAALRFGVNRVALPAALPLLLSVIGPFQWVLASGMAPAPMIGWLAAVQVQRGRSYGQIIALASLPGLALGLMQASGLGGPDAQRERVGGEVAAFLEGAGGEAPDAAMLQELVELLLMLLPGMAYLSVLLIAVLGYRLAVAIGERTGTRLPPAVPLRDWRLWEELIWLPIGALALMLLGGESIRGIAVNVALVMLLLYAAQGLGLVRFLLWRLGAQRFLVVLVYVLLAFTSSVSLLALAFSGLADTWFDWRRLGHRRDEDSDQEINT